MTGLATILNDQGEWITVETPNAGERCQVCDRRVPKPRQSTSPTSKRIVVTLPTERAQNVDDALEALQAYVGADQTSYPRGSILELLVILGGQHREQLRDWFGHREVE